MISPPVLTSDAVHAFGVFAQHLNFTSAANELHLSQPSLHTKVNKLGRALGIELYERRGRDLILTNSGKALAQFAVEADGHAGAFYRDLRDQPPRVSIFAGRAMLRWIMGERITSVVRLGVEIDVTEADRDSALEALADGRADVAGIAADAPPASFESESVAVVDQVLLIPRRHALAKKTTVAIVDFASMPLVLPSRGRPHRTRVEAAFAEAGQVPLVAAEVDGWELMAHMASLGLGAAIVNGLVPAPKGMVAVPIADLPPVEYWLAWQPDRRNLAEHLRLDHGS